MLRTALSGAASGVAFGFAGYCTLESDNEIGTAAAYVTALFFAIFALTGCVPGIKIGDNEIIVPQAIAAGAELGADLAAEAAENAAKSNGDPSAVAAAATKTAKNLRYKPKRGATLADRIRWEMEHPDPSWPDAMTEEQLEAVARIMGPGLRRLAGKDS